MKATGNQALTGTTSTLRLPAAPVPASDRKAAGTMAISADQPTARPIWLHENDSMPASAGWPATIGLPAEVAPSSPFATPVSPVASPAAAPVSSPAAAPAPASGNFAAELLRVLADVTRALAQVVSVLPALIDRLVAKSRFASEGAAGRRKRQAGEDKEGRKARGKRQGSESPGSNGHEAGQPAASRDDAAGNEGRTGKSNSKKANPGKAGGTGRSTTKPRRGRNGEIRTVMRNGEPIGAHIADAYDRMAAAARQDGVTLRVNSGYRSHAEQVRLWNANPNPALVARPGTSNHESGSAIDFANVGRAWSWLKRNAQRFGFRNYPVEAWHYDYVGGKA